MTLQVRAGMAEGRFEDAARVDRLDGLFAQRYFDAYDAHRAGATPTQAWAVAFAQTGRGDLMNQVFQEIDQLSPVLAVLDRLGGRFEKRVMNLSIDLARYEAWHLAQSLAFRHPDDRAAVIAPPGRRGGRPGP